MIEWLLTGPRWIWGYLVVFAFSFSIGCLSQYYPVPSGATSVTLFAFCAIILLNMFPVVVFSVAGVPRLPAHPCRVSPPARVRFLVVVAAYNESRVIHNSVSSIMGQESQFSECQLYVAFNGTDDTGDIARALGAQVITTPKPQCGKTQAIAFALEQIEPDPERYVVILDADNLTDPDFLDQLALVARTGALAVQGNHRVLLANRNWVSRGLAAGYAASSRLFNPGRARLLESALLCGTGFAVREDVFRNLWSKIRTQTEDIELNALLSLEYGSGVQWAQQAQFFDEKPDTIRVAIRQRVRWMVGHMRCFRIYTLPLLKYGTKHRSLRAVELAAYYAVPWTILLAALWLTVVFPASVFDGLAFGGMSQPISLTLSGLIGVYIVGLPFAGQMMSDDRQCRSIRAVIDALRDAFASAVFALLVWPLAIMLATLMLARDDWIFHTPHKAMKARR